MGVVKDKLLDSGARPRVVADCARLVDAEVASKRGATGLIIKGGYKMFKALRPRIVETAVEGLLDEFVPVVDRYHEEYLEKEPEGRAKFDAWLKRNDLRLADDLLKITDGIMERSDKQALKKIYYKLRKIAQRNVADAAPAVGRLVLSHIA